jgi:hypothetical protein
MTRTEGSTMTQASVQLSLRQRITRGCGGTVVLAVILIGTAALVSSRETVCRPNATAGRMVSVLSGVGCNVAIYAPRIGREAHKIATHHTAHEAWKRLGVLK